MVKLHDSISNIQNRNIRSGTPCVRVCVGGGVGVWVCECVCVCVGGGVGV